jgi:hypothetical protein
VAQIAKTVIILQTSFFWKGERILSKPETATILHTQKAIAVEKEVVVHIKTESTKLYPRDGR